MLVTLVLMGIAGSIIDGLNNELLRSPIESLNSSIQFYVDHQGQQVDPADFAQNASRSTARDQGSYHLAATIDH